MHDLNRRAAVESPVGEGKTTPLKVAIVGCGWVAGTQVKEGFSALPNLFALEACCDSVAERAQAFATEHRIPRWAGDFEEVIGLPEIDVVSICTPPMLHHPMA
ncbi:MAG: Gfo/Idh/MocA family protein, partial [Acetobacteraceae bacterium]